MRRLILAVALSTACWFGPAAAQQTTAPRPMPTPKPTGQAESAASLDAAAAEARQREDERRKRWDERMRRVSRSVCDRC